MKSATLPIHSTSTYSITELCKEFNATHRALRFYESKGLLNPKRSGTQRIYSDKDRVRVRMIMEGRSLGFTLQEIAEILKKSGAVTNFLDCLSIKQVNEQITHLERQIEENEVAVEKLKLRL